VENAFKKNRGKNVMVAGSSASETGKLLSRGAQLQNILVLSFGQGLRRVSGVTPAER
jgi:hypothetical protein